MRLSYLLGKEVFSHEHEQYPARPLGAEYVCADGSNRDGQRRARAGNGTFAAIAGIFGCHARLEQLEGAARDEARGGKHRSSRCVGRQHQTAIACHDGMGYARHPVYRPDDVDLVRCRRAVRRLALCAAHCAACGRVRPDAPVWTQGRIEQQWAWLGRCPAGDDRRVRRRAAASAVQPDGGTRLHCGAQPVLPAGRKRHSGAHHLRDRGAGGVDPPVQASC